MKTRMNTDFFNFNFPLLLFCPPLFCLKIFCLKIFCLRKRHLCSLD